MHLRCSPDVPRNVSLAASTLMSSPCQHSHEASISSDSRRRRESKKTARSRRRNACQTCRLRKVKCDNFRPRCTFCQSKELECVYLDDSRDRMQADPATRLMINRLDEILHGVRSIASLTPHGITGPGPSSNESLGLHRTISSNEVTPSKDYLNVPGGRSGADNILTWPIFQGAYPPEHLIEPLFNVRAATEAGNTVRSSSNNHSFPPGTFQPLSDERIPGLIDRFLQNAHTKNPILDVESLVRYGRDAAENGLRWDAPSCLVLLACALGSVSHPFTVAADIPDFGPDGDRLGYSITSTRSFAGDLRLAESCFSLAGRRIGLLRYGILGAQCHFFAGGKLIASSHDTEQY